MKMKKKKGLGRSIVRKQALQKPVCTAGRVHVGSREDHMSN
jgi:hypothetical protein